MSGRIGRISILLVVCTVMASLTLSCGEETVSTPTPAPTPMTLYQSTEHGFSIDCPEGWTANAQVRGASFTLEFTDPEGHLSEMVYVEYSDKDTPLADFVTASKTYMESTPGFEMISEGDIIIGKGIDGYQMAGLGDFGTGEVEQFEFILFTYGKQCFSIGVSGEPTGFEQSQALIDAIIDSFELLSAYTFLPPTPSAGSTYTNAEYGFSITYPEGWLEAPTGRPGEIIAFSAIQGIPNVSINMSPAAEGTTLAEYGPQLSQDLEQYWQDYELVSEGEVTLDDGTAAYEIVFAGTMEGYNLKNKYVIVIQGTQALFIMGISTPASFEQDEAVLDQVIHSFHLD